LKQLLLIRHAKSSWKDVTLLDFYRPLSGRGKKEATILGKLLKKNALFPDLAISSPAKRAIKTTKKIIRELNYPEDKIETDKLIYSGSTSNLFECIRSIDKTVNFVFMIGHNPTLLEFGNTLTGSNIEKLPTSGFILIKFYVNSWKDITFSSGKILQIGRAK
jgi:phosphohistidine phosphatase